MVQRETLTLDHPSLISCTCNIAFIICRSALLQHDAALPENSSQARWKIVWSIHEQSSLRAMSKVEPYEGMVCDTAVEEHIFQCICTQKTATLMHGVELHWFPHCSSPELNSVELSLTAYGDYRCMWWFLIFYWEQLLEDNEGFVLPVTFTATGR